MGGDANVEWAWRSGHRAISGINPSAVLVRTQLKKHRSVHPAAIHLVAGNHRMNQAVDLDSSQRYVFR